MENKKDNATYKVVTPLSEHAIYFTVVGNPNPIAFFINSKEMESFQWITALMTSYSKQIKAGIELNDIINDMKETFDPSGSYIIPDGSGRKVNSIVHHLGLIIEQHSKTDFTNIIER